MISLSLANGSCWGFEALDDGAEKAIDRLGAAMQLGTGVPTRILEIATDPEPHALTVSDDGLRAARIRVMPDYNDRMAEAVQMVLIATSVALLEQARGALLVHASLGVRGGAGVLFSGPGEVGKTTTVNRLPVPWEAWADDAALVVPTAGGFRVHPWPSWSRFMFDGPGGSWATGEHAALQQLFFLEQAATDETRPLGQGQAVCLLSQTVDQLAIANLKHYDAALQQKFRLQAFENVCALVKQVPVNLLCLSLTGNFWELLERH